MIKWATIVRDFVVGVPVVLFGVYVLLFADDPRHDAVRRAVASLLLVTLGGNFVVAGIALRLGRRIWLYPQLAALGVVVWLR